MTNSKSPVTVTLEELRTGSVPFSALEEAFGPSSLGIIVVKGLPDQFHQFRHMLLSYSSYLANLPEEELRRLESPEAKYLTGWSRGKETLKNGQYDTLKGSYYVNCAPGFEDPAQREKLASAYPGFPEYTAANVWPPEELLPGFEGAFRALCELIVDTAVLVARACDRYAEVHVGCDDNGGNEMGGGTGGYQRGFLEHVVRTSLTTKARLLHYFPSEGGNEESNVLDDSSNKKKDADASPDDWCATHVDHGCLTGLTSAMFIDETSSDVADALATLKPPSTTNHHSHQQHHSPTDTKTTLPTPLPELPSSPDPAAGLYIHARDGTVTKVSIPRDSLAFQTGEALELITRGKFRAVPHFVRGVSASRAKLKGTDTEGGNGAGGDEKVAGGGDNVVGSEQRPRPRVARNTLAVFTQPNLWEMVDGERDFAAFARAVVEQNH